ncbi:MAG: hypothetical protein MHMPM18_001274 [Marteilia pararefringens]
MDLSSIILGSNSCLLDSKGVSHLHSRSSKNRFGGFMVRLIFEKWRGLVSERRKCTVEAKKLRIRSGASKLLDWKTLGDLEEKYRILKLQRSLKAGETNKSLEKGCRISRGEKDKPRGDCNYQVNLLIKRRFCALERKILNFDRRSTNNETSQCSQIAEKSDQTKKKSDKKPKITLRERIDQV